MKDKDSKMLEESYNNIINRTAPDRSAAEPRRFEIFSDSELKEIFSRISDIEAIILENKNLHQGDKLNLKQNIKNFFNNLLAS